MLGGMTSQRTGGTLDDWSLIQRLLPSGWEAQAKVCGALRRTRVIRDAPTLLRILLVHLADGCSLAETAARAAELGWCRISVVAIIKRLRASAAWLNWMAQSLWIAGKRKLPKLGRRVRAVDSTWVLESGATGSRWRIHYALNLANLRCEHFEVTDEHVGESLTRFPIEPGDVLIADRGLALASGIGHVAQRGGMVLVRTTLNNLPLFDVKGRRVRILPRLRRLRVGVAQEWPLCVKGPSPSLIAGRLIAVRRSARAAEAARRRVRRRAQKTGHVIKPATLEAAGYFLVWTNVPASELANSAALELYRSRWQIELAFKRSKTLLGLGQLPKHNDDSSRAWLHGKLLVALLVERLIAEAEAFSPWGYALEEAPQSVARSPLDGARTRSRRLAAPGRAALAEPLDENRATTMQPRRKEYLELS